MERLTELDKRERCLRISLLPAGRERKELLIAPTRDALVELLEYHLCNGWEWVLPEEITALTSAPILSDGTDTYWHERYQIEDPIFELFNMGYVDFPLAD